MRIEYLFGMTYRIIPEKGDCAKASEQERILRRAAEIIESERGEYIPPSQMKAERLFSPDGAAVIYMRAAEERRPHVFFACDIDGNAEVGRLCRALCAAGELSDGIRFFLGEGEAWRVILTDPGDTAEKICREFGDWCEVSAFFAALTAERLDEAARGREIAILGQVL